MSLIGPSPFIDKKLLFHVTMPDSEESKAKLDWDGRFRGLDWGKQCNESPWLFPTVPEKLMDTHIRVNKTPACGLLASVFWLSCPPTGSSLFFRLVYLLFCLQHLPQCNNKHIISNKYQNSRTYKPDNGHIVEWDMSSLTGKFISMNWFSDTRHRFLRALQGQLRYAESHCFQAFRYKTLETGRLLVKELWGGEFKPHPLPFKTHWAPDSSAFTQPKSFLQCRAWWKTNSL